MPLDNAHTALVAAKVNHGLSQVLREAALGQLPDLIQFLRVAEGRKHEGKGGERGGWWRAERSRTHLDGAILRRRGNDVVVKGAELNVEDRGRVAGHLGVVQIDAARLIKGVGERGG